MLFLAVTLGFLAENLREVYVEKERSHELVNTLVKEVESNVKFIDSLLIGDKDFVMKSDSAIYYIITTKDPIDLKRVYSSFLNGRRYLSNNDTYDQMKSSGSLRYIKDSQLLNKIITYSNLSKATEFRSATQEYDYTAHEYENTLNKYIPTEMATYKHASLLINNDFYQQALNLDSTQADILFKLRNLEKEKNCLLPKEREASFKNEIIPVILRNNNLIVTSMYFKLKTKKAAEELLAYYYKTNHE
jgi:hypothetical protein